MLSPMISDVVAGLLGVVKTSGIPNPQSAMNKHLLSGHKEQGW